MNASFYGNHQLPRLRTRAAEHLRQPNSLLPQKSTFRSHPQINLTLSLYNKHPVRFIRYSKTTSENRCFDEDRNLDSLVLFIK
ncbi:hypothetical protein CEXT_194821 [Caerostris extrusa]|uniref:Uncharacterized protein n=1 Tax=Caerostris extrusa TaxID=172846 RepID=A0AAV4VZB5_CAEEX|nr:hypothetical protein CEXT_194821 [Caerostris extrusa]